MCAGTHPFTDWQSQLISPKERYLELVERMQWMARRMQIFGVHVHVGVRAPEKAIPIVNALCQYIPHFLALSSSSPFWVGCDTGLASSRTKIFEGMPTAGLPYQLADWAQFEEYMETLISTKSIESVREVWWDVRPHPDFGTVELRICDGLPTLDEIGAVAALAQCLVEQFDTQLDRGYTLPTPASWVLRENKWRASRYGLDADIVVDEKGTVRPVRQAIVDLVEELRPTAKRLDCEAELADVLRVLDVGASYQRQRAVAAAHDGKLRAGRRQPAGRDAGRAARDRPRRPAHRAGARSGRLRRGACGVTAVVGELGAAVDDWVEAHEAELIAARRHLHAHPELAYAEVETTAWLEQRLREAGLSPHRLPRGTGLVVEVGDGPGPTSSCAGTSTRSRCPTSRTSRTPRPARGWPTPAGTTSTPPSSSAWPWRWPRSAACPAGCAASSSPPRRPCPEVPPRWSPRARSTAPAAPSPCTATPRCRWAASACAPAPSPPPATASTSR